MKPTAVAAKLGCTTALVYNVRARMGGAKKKRASAGPKPKRSAAAAPARPTGLDGLLGAVKDAEQERVKMRAAIERIQKILADALE